MALRLRCLSRNSDRPSTRQDSHRTVANNTSFSSHHNSPLSAKLFPEFEPLAATQLKEISLSPTFNRRAPHKQLTKLEHVTAETNSKRRLGFMTALTHLEALTTTIDSAKLIPAATATMHVFDKLSPREQRHRQATLRRLRIEEQHAMHTLAEFEVAEERRTRAVTQYVDKPIRDKIDRRALLWLQAISCMRPVKMFRELMKQNKARRILRDMFVAQFVRFIHIKKKRRKRAELTDERLPSMRRPTVDSLRKNEIFERVPDENLRTMIVSMTPMSYRSGEVITHEGDWGTEMWMIDRGCVETRIRVLMGKQRHKSRGQQNTSVVSRMDTPGTCFGEFALLTKEPRSSTFVCVLDTDTWVLTRASFEAAMSKLPPDTFQDLQQKADERQKVNMSKLYGMTEASLRLACKFIDRWSTRGVQKMLRRLEPRIYHKGAYLFKEGSPAEGIFFLVSGRVEMLKDGQSGRVAVLSATTAFGEPGTVVTGKYSSTVRALSQCDVWLCPRGDVMDAMGHERLYCIMPLLQTHTEYVIAT